MGRGPKNSAGRRQGKTGRAADGSGPGGLDAGPGGAGAHRGLCWNSGWLKVPKVEETFLPLS